MIEIYLITSNEFNSVNIVRTQTFYTFYSLIQYRYMYLQVLLINVRITFTALFST